MNTDYALIWEGEIIPNAKQIAKVRSEIDYICEQIETASDLYFHQVFLADDLDGPSIFVYSKEGDDNTFYAECHLETKWVDINDDEDETDR